MTPEVYTPYKLRSSYGENTITRSSTWKFALWNSQEPLGAKYQNKYIKIMTGNQAAKDPALVLYWVQSSMKLTKSLQ